jgi:hypothetical protein
MAVLLVTGAETEPMRFDPPFSAEHTRSKAR